MVDWSILKDNGGGGGRNIRTHLASRTHAVALVSRVSAGLVLTYHVARIRTVSYRLIVSGGHTFPTMVPHVYFIGKRREVS
jgi:hypothetical protein